MNNTYFTEYRRGVLPRSKLHTGITRHTEFVKQLSVYSVSSVHVDHASEMVVCQRDAEEEKREDAVFSRRVCPLL